MATPTTKDIMVWPKPNHENLASLAPAVYPFNILGIVFMTLFVAARLWSRTKIVKKSLTPDDGIMLVPYILCVILEVFHMVEVGLKTGIGLHLYDVAFSDFDKIGKMTIVTQFTFAPVASLTKIFICLSYTRLFPTTTNWWFNRVLISILAFFTFSSCFVIGFQCLPLKDAWNFIKPAADKHCINSMAWWTYSASFNAATDLLVYLWPIHYLMAVRVATSKRIGLIVCFGVGVVICIVAFVRVWRTVLYFRSWDASWNGAIVYLLVSIEMSLGVICGCLPSVRPLMTRLSSKLNMSNLASESDPDGSDNYLDKRRANRTIGGGGDRFRNLKNSELSTDIELGTEDGITEVVSSDTEKRPSSAVLRETAKDWKVPNHAITACR